MPVLTFSLLQYSGVFVNRSRGFRTVAAVAAAAAAGGAVEVGMVEAEDGEEADEEAAADSSVLVLRAEAVGAAAGAGYSAAMLA